LGEALHAVEMYIPVVVTDKMIGIKRNKSSIARREMRRTYFEQLRFTDMAIKLHTYKRGGPYPNLVHVWKTPPTADIPLDETANADGGGTSPPSSRRSW
jgi:hypothetical protein